LQKENALYRPTDRVREIGRASLASASFWFPLLGRDSLALLAHHLFARMAHEGFAGPALNTHRDQLLA
jgi:hypothetical protein